MDWASIARLTVHLTTCLVAAGLLLNELRWKPTKTDVLMWIVYIVTIFSSAALANYFAGILGGWYTPDIDGPRLVRVPGLFAYVVVTFTLFIVRYQRDQRRYWQKRSMEQSEEIEYLKLIVDKQRNRLTKQDELISRQMERRLVPVPPEG